MTPNAGENVEKLCHSEIAGENIKGYIHSGGGGGGKYCSWLQN